MPPDPEHAVILTCHPETRCDAVRSIGARLRRSAGGKLAVTYVLEGRLEDVRVPAPGEARFVNGLWHHTCCEIFIARKGVTAYHEFNFSPSGEWAAYAFDDYRVPRPDDSRAAVPYPEIVVRDSRNRLELDAMVRLDCLSSLHASAPLSLAVSAVVEDRDGALSYWALRHPAGPPDFHRPDGFALCLQGAEG